MGSSGCRVVRESFRGTPKEPLGVFGAEGVRLRVQEATLHKRGLGFRV